MMACHINKTETKPNRTEPECECECECCVSIMSVTNEHTSGENVAQNSTLTSDTDQALAYGSNGEYGTGCDLIAICLTTFSVILVANAKCFYPACQTF